MRLLDPKQVKKEKDQSEEERRERIKKLYQEETELTKKVNAMRDDIEEKEVLKESEKSRIENELREFQESAENRKKELSKEVASLEARKSEALKPIHEIQAEAEKRLEAAKDQEILNENIRVALEKDRENLAERVEDVADCEVEIVEKNTELDTRTRKVAEEEKRLKESSEKLAENWLTYHSEVNKTNKALAQARKEVEGQRKANDSIRQSNQQESDRLTQERRAIHDTYLAIAQAKKHLGILE